MALKKIRTGIIGLGHIGKTHIAALQDSPDFELIAACDRNTDLSAIVPSSVAFFTSHFKMLDDGGFETVIIATPNITHNAIAIDALRAGFNVIIEKPAAMSMEELYALEGAARAAQRHIYYAFHAAMACEVAWLAPHLRDNAHIYGPLTSFYSRFFDPYVSVDGKICEDAASLDNCWSDSGVNALSVIHEILPVDRLTVESIRQSQLEKKTSDLSSMSVRFSFPVHSEDKSGLGIIETAWDQGKNFKCTDLNFGLTGWRLVADHSSQSVTAYHPNGCKQVLVEFDGDRLLNHYRGVFADYCECLRNQRMNGESALAIHRKLFAAFSA